MGSGFQWGLWIATCLLVVGLAKFLDEYHIRNDLKSRVRDGLIAIFLFIDRPKIANFPGVLYTYLAAALERLGKLGSIIAICATYFAIVACFYFGRLLFGKPPESGLLTYLLTWVSSAFWAVVVLWGICTGAASFLEVVPEFCTGR
jgi:hypothetical protein